MSGAFPSLAAPKEMEEAMKTHNHLQWERSFELLRLFMQHSEAEPTRKLQPSLNRFLGTNRCIYHIPRRPETTPKCGESESPVPLSMGEVRGDRH
jgi:hypothetical protein